MEDTPLSGYKCVWLFTIFDLPVGTKQARKRYRQFRKELLAEGFLQLQYSVYARFFNKETRAKRLRDRLRPGIPPGGRVRFLIITDAQYAKMESYYGTKRVETESKPDQLRLF